VRAAIDMWTPLTTMKTDAILGEERAQLKLDTYVRSDVRVSHETWAGLWLRYQDKDLSEGGKDECFEVSTEETEDGETIPCAGRQLTTLARVQVKPHRTLQVTAMLEHQLLDDEAATMGDEFRQDWGAWLIALWHPQKRMRVRARARYLDESSDLLGGGEDDNLERSVSFLFDMLFGLREKDSLRLRTDAKFYLDDRMSTDDREPNPDIQLWLQYETRL
jgi:hypothetical protein